MNDREDLTKYDGLTAWRCPMLGDTVPFLYCRTMNRGLPCARIVECWQSRIDVVAFLSEHYERADLERIFAAQPLEKAVQLLELIRRARGE